MNMEERIKWIDIGKCFCIIFVIIQHLQSGSQQLYQFYSPFYLTSFFFFSGYVYKHKGSFSTHIKNKINQLFIPWLILSNLNLLLSAIITLQGQRNILKELFINLFQIRAYGDGLWFVAALFVAYIPFYFVISWNRKKMAIIISLLLSIISVLYTYFMPISLFYWGSNALPWHLEYIFQAMFWMVIGYYFKHSFEKIIDKENKLLMRYAVLAGYLILAYLPTRYFPIFLVIFLSYVRSGFGILSIVFVCKLIKQNKYLEFVGANTLSYFAFHGKVFVVIEELLSRSMGSYYIMLLSNSLYSSLMAIIVTILVVLILIIPIKIINRYIPWIVGKPQKSCNIKHNKIKDNNLRY
jgi:fucose 4-O-acetylase-like acetyltransferase